MKNLGTSSALRNATVAGLSLVGTLMAMHATLAADVNKSPALSNPLLTFKELNATWTNSTLPELKAAAESGDATAQCYLGERLSAGKDVARDPAQAAVWYRKAADQGLAYAQTRLGWAYEAGAGIPKSRELAMEWTRKAADQGFTQAELNLGWMHAMDDVKPGETITGNYPVAAEWYEKAAKKGDPNAQYQLADLYLYRKLGDEQRTNCIEWFLKAAKQGHTRAQAMVGELPRYFPNHPLLKTGDTVPFLLQAAETGDFHAQWEAARRYRVGDGVEKNAAEGFRWMKKAAESSSSSSLVWDARYELAVMYENAEGVARDLDQAWPLYLSSSFSSPSAQFRVGRMYEEGTGVAKDDQQAAEYFLQAAARGWGEHRHEAGERGLSLYAAGRGLPGDRSEVEKTLKRIRNSGLSSKGNFLLGEILMAGKIVDKDTAAAVKYFTEAARLGSAEAMNRLGQMWAAGLEGQPDHKEAATWYRKAAGQGFAEAQFNLGLCYAKGEGVTQSTVEAWQWLSLAEAQKFARAEAERKRVEAFMTPEQLAAARDKAKQFKPAPSKPNAR